MPYVYVYQCNQCGFDAEIALCKEFRRDSDGSRVDFEYPDPDLYEWPPRKVSGLWSRLWCDHCGEVRSQVVVELDEPAEHPVQAFLAAEARGLTGAEAGPCPICSRPLTAEPDGATCHRCRTGHLACIGEYEP